jgi:hypothetical protein
MLLRPGLGEAHEMLEVQVMLEFGGFVRRETRRFLPGDKLGNPRLRGLGRSKRGNGFRLRAGGDELDDFFVRSDHLHSLAAYEPDLRGSCALLAPPAPRDRGYGIITRSGMRRFLRIPPASRLLWHRKKLTSFSIHLLGLLSPQAKASVGTGERDGRASRGLARAKEESS